MAQSIAARLQQELMQIMMSAGDSEGVSAFPEGDDLMHWTGTINGSKGTVYEGLEYKLSIEFPQDYPMKAPTVKFVTPCFHPNVDQHGNICLDILKEKWAASYSVKTLLISLQSLLSDPNVDSPLNVDAANLWSDQVRATLPADLFGTHCVPPPRSCFMLACLPSDGVREDLPRKVCC